MYLTRKTIMNYLLGNEELVKKAFAVAEQLNQWFENSQRVVIKPVVCAVVGTDELFIKIEEIVVWSSLINEDEDLTIEECKKEYRREIQNLANVFQNF